MIRYSMFEILQKASQLQTREEKVNWLRQQWNPALGHVLRFTYDPEIIWMLPPGDPPYRPVESVDAQGMLYTEARKLYLFVKGGKDDLSPIRRETLFIQLLESVDPQDAQLLLSMKNKRLPFEGIDPDIIREAYPGLLPPPIEVEATVEDVVEETEPVEEVVEVKAPVKKAVAKKKPKKPTKKGDSKKVNRHEQVT